MLLEGLSLLGNTKYSNRTLEFLKIKRKPSQITEDHISSNTKKAMRQAIINTVLFEIASAGMILLCFESPLALMFIALASILYFGKTLNNIKLNLPYCLPKCRRSEQVQIIDEAEDGFEELEDKERVVNIMRKYSM